MRGKKKKIYPLWPKLLCQLPPENLARIPQRMWDLKKLHPWSRIFSSHLTGLITTTERAHQFEPWADRWPTVATLTPPFLYLSLQPVRLPPVLRRERLEALWANSKSWLRVWRPLLGWYFWLRWACMRCTVNLMLHQRYETLVFRFWPGISSSVFGI